LRARCLPREGVVRGFVGRHLGRVDGRKRGREREREMIGDERGTRQLLNEGKSLSYEAEKERNSAQTFSTASSSPTQRMLDAYKPTTVLYLRVRRELEVRKRGHVEAQFGDNRFDGRAMHLI